MLPVMLGLNLLFIVSSLSMIRKYRELGRKYLKNASKTNQIYIFLSKLIPGMYKGGWAIVTGRRLEVYSASFPWHLSTAPVPCLLLHPATCRGLQLWWMEALALLAGALPRRKGSELPCTTSLLLVLYQDIQTLFHRTVQYSITLYITVWYCTVQ